jgi:23S rRNA (pseudouridine1915-N3)-methyltransferase
MKIEIVCVGRTRQDFLLDGLAEYEKRLQPFASIDWKVIPAVTLTPALTVELVKEREAKAMLTALENKCPTIVLDERGEEMNSVAFAGLFDVPRLRFVIGGPYGMADVIRARADRVLAFSRFTFTHEMIRLALLEQVYRAFTIRTGKKYHY